MTPFLRKMHKWVGLVVGLQFLLWLASGMVMSLFDRDVVEGMAHRAPLKAAAEWPRTGLVAPADVLAASRKPVESIDSRWLLQVPAYLLKNGEGSWLVDARNGAPLAVSAAQALEVARADYVGDGKAGQPQWVAKPTLEIRKHRGASWRIDFDDAEATTIYVSAVDGRILERRNATWRLFDIAWMLHIMDYGGREDFNNSLLLMAALGGLWMALSGIWLLCTQRSQRTISSRRAFCLRGRLRCLMKAESASASSNPVTAIRCSTRWRARGYSCRPTAAAAKAAGCARCVPAITRRLHRHPTASIFPTSACAAATGWPAVWR